jgi:uncharacterized protein (TIRG00374 family)
MRRRLLLPFLAILIIVVLLSLFVDGATVIRQLRHADPVYLLSACVALLGGLVAYANRWRVLLSNKPGWLATFHAGNVGHMFNTLIPFRAGEPARIVVLSQNQKLPLAEVTASVVVELLIEQMMRISAFIGALAFGVGLEPRAAGGGVILLLFITGSLVWLVKQRDFVLARIPHYLSRLPRVGEARSREVLGNLLNGLAAVSSARRLGLALFWSFLIWSSFSLFHYLLLLALNLELLPGQAVAISLGALALAPPSAPTQPGVYHTFVIGALVLAGFNLHAVTSYAIILHALQMFWMITLGSWALSQTGVSFRQLLPGNVTKRTSLTRMEQSADS